MQKRIESRSRGRRTERRGAGLGRKERRRLLQLLLCALLFAVVLAGKGLAPERLARSGESVLRLIRTDTDFQSAFTALGQAVSQGDSLLECLETLAVQAFGAGEASRPAQAPDDGLAAQAVMGYLSAAAGTQAVPQPQGGALRRSGDAGEQAPGETGAGEEDLAAAPTRLPEGATMEYVELGLEETVTPVFGVVSSSFGYREDPFTGETAFHSGVDIAAAEGTPILAFADGTVEWTGEDDTSGLYLQLDHGGSVESFYCHCSALYVGEGETVGKGQVIAAVGATGHATGPHLHFALKSGGVRLDPVYYIETAG